MKSFSLAFGFAGLMAVASAQPPAQQGTAAGMDSAVRRAFLEAPTPPQQDLGAYLARISQQPPRVRMSPMPPPRVEAFADKCAVPLLNVPIRKDVEYAMRIQKTPKDIDSHITVAPPIPACPDR